MILSPHFIQNKSNLKPTSNIFHALCIFSDQSLLKYIAIMSVSSPASLVTLPSELLNLVVSHIGSQSTLRNLARCSRLLHVCTKPYLYANTTIQVDREQQDERLIILATSILRCPALGELVRQFSLHVPKPSKAERHRSIKMAKANKDFATAMHLSGFSQGGYINYPEFYNHTRGLRYDFILSFLLPFLPKVEKLLLDVDIDVFAPLCEKAIAKAITTKTAFEALRVFVHSPRNEQNARPLRFLALLLKLPAIQEISGAYERFEDTKNETLAYGHLKELVGSSSPLTSLDIVTVNTRPADLYHILRAPIALNHFSFMVSSHCVIRSVDLNYVLEPQKDLLKSITIDLDFSSHHFGVMGSFTSFGALKIFKTVPQFLLETVYGEDHRRLLNIFPASLEVLDVLRFESHSKRLLEALGYLLVCKSPQQIPSLQTLILEEEIVDGIRLMDILRGDTQERAVESLGRVARSQNVTLEVIEKERRVESVGVLEE